ncbi:MAG: type I methionyl aminopeptidase [Chloroflexi bacterium]|nr:type I methionyl aminopeptidase [Chloroflexota bacterium]
MESPEAARRPSIKSPRELEAMREAGQVVARMIAAITRAVEPGMTTQDLDDVAVQELQRHDAKPAFLGYLGFPATICTSVNEEIVHGIPGKRVLKEGDLVKCDVGAIVDGMHGDAAVTLPVGEVSGEALQLIEVTRESLNEAIAQVRAGARLGDIGEAVQKYAEVRGYGVVREYVGHGIGRRLHEEPQVPNYGVAGRGQMLRAGMAIAVEPMLNVGTWRTRTLEDGWTVVTADGRLSAHFEHTMAVGEDGAEVMTRLRD